MYQSFSEAARASGKRLDATQRQSVADADRDPRCVALDLFLRCGRLCLRRTEQGVTWEVTP